MKKSYKYTSQKLPTGVLLLLALVSCAVVDGDPALDQRSGVVITHDNLVPVILTTLDVLYAHGEMPVKVSDLQVTVLDQGGVMIGPTSRKLACEGDSVDQVGSRIDAVLNQANAFNYRFDSCQTDYKDENNYDLLNGAVKIRNLVDNSDTCNAYSGELFYEGMSLDRVEQGVSTYTLDGIRGRYDFSVDGEDADENGACETRSTRIAGNTLSYFLDGQLIEESHYTSQEIEVPETGEFSVMLDSYILTDELEGRFRLQTLQAFTGVRGNSYPDSGQFTLTGTGVTQVTVEILSNVYEDRKALRLDIDINPADGILDTPYPVYLSWCELELGAECLLDEL